jgi:hypothetical protein
MMKGNSGTMSKKAGRGKDIVVATGRDSSSMGSTGTGSLSPKMGGGRADLSHSVSGASVPKAGK